MIYPAMDDTIAAVATPPGKGLRGVIRVSGPLTHRVLERVFQGEPPLVPRSDMARSRRVRGRVALEPEHYTLPAEVLLFRAPRSYTRQDVAELHVVGSPAVLAVLMDQICACGVRLAGPGEFTARAFHNGALSIDDVQGIAALIHARSDQQLRAANDWIDARLGSEVALQRDALIQLCSLVEAEIDFSDEPIDFITARRLQEELQAIITVLQRLRHEIREAERTGAPPRVLLIGRPNVGKSTLLNRLSGMDRALCSSISGSTRDFLSAIARVGQHEIELLDTPGMGVSIQKKQKNAKNFLERQTARADLICHVLELGNRPLQEQVLDGSRDLRDRVLWVANKADLLGRDELEKVLARWSDQLNGTVVAISARNDTGLTTLGAEIARRLTKHVGNHGIAIAPVHAHALSDALESLIRARSWCAQSDDVVGSAEFIASDLHDAVHALSALFGEVTPDDLLERIFNDFCIGK